MPRSKPKWNYKPPSGVTGDYMPSKEFIGQVIKILNPNNERALNKALVAIWAIMAGYQSNKKSWPSYNKELPSEGDIGAAANSVIKDIEKLTSKLSGQAGGLRAAIDVNDTIRRSELIKQADKMDDFLELMKYSRMTHLLNELDFLKSCCTNVIKDIDCPSPQSKRFKKIPKQSLVDSVGSGLFRRALQIQPNYYLSSDLGKSGKFAQVLSLFFMEADNCVPGNLKALMTQEKKNWDSLFEEP